MRLVKKYAIYSFFGIAPGAIFGYQLDTWQFWVFIVIVNVLMAWKQWG